MTTISSVPKPSSVSREAASLREALKDIQAQNPAAEEVRDKGEGSSIRVILADSEAIFRVGMARILASETDLEIVGQADTLPQTMATVAATPANVILFEIGLSPTPAEAITEVMRRAIPGAQLVLVTSQTGQQETVEYLRRGVRGILPRAVSPELLVRCVRKVAAGETWLDKQSVNWVIEAYRTQALQGTAPKQQLRLSEKELQIISGVTQGLKNKDIAREIGTTEQVIKNYLRKIYDKLQVMDRLELALYSMHHRLLDGYVRNSEDQRRLEAERQSGGNPRQAASAAVSRNPSAAPPYSREMNDDSDGA